MKNNDSSAELKEIPIPEYITIQERLKCSHCKYHSSSWKECRKNSSNIKSRFSCYFFYNAFAVSKFVFSVILLICAIVYSFMHFSSFWNSTLIMAVVTCSIIFVDIISDVILKHLSLHLENRRKQKYNRKVEQIEEQNKIIRKQMMGISDEYEAFTSNSKVLYSLLEKVSKEISSLFNSNSKYEERIMQKYGEVLNELSALNDKLSMYNYEDSTIVPIYTVYLPRLKDDSYYLIELLKKDKLTEKQKIEFSNLLEVFRKKLENENSYLDHRLETDFITKMEALNKDMLPEYNGGEDS